MRGGQKHVLVVDDNDDVRASLGLVVEASGYRVDMAEDGVEALQKLRGGDQPGLVLLDLNMPNMDGQELRREMLKDRELSGLPVVLLSAAPDIRSVANKMKATDYMRKPCDLGKLSRLLRAYCG